MWIRVSYHLLAGYPGATKMSDIDDDELKELKALQEKKELYEWADDNVE